MRLIKDARLVIETITRLFVEFVSKSIEYLNVTSYAVFSFFCGEAGRNYVGDRSPEPRDLNPLPCLFRQFEESGTIIAELRK